MRLFFSKKKEKALVQGLQKTKNNFWSRFTKLMSGKSRVDAACLETLAELLLTADVGVATTEKIISRLEKRIARDRSINIQALDNLLQEEIATLFTDTSFPPVEATPPIPFVVLVVGVNGVGKTTTIGKLAAQHKQANRKVIIGAADTFRAAAVSQLQQWGERVGATVVACDGHTDPSAVAYKTIQEGIRVQAEVILIDTAGRLHTKVPLMQELAKIRRTIQKLIPEAPHEVLLVLDGSTGQNAFVQAEAFIGVAAVTALAITKLDGTAKGGAILGIVDQFKVPVKYIGIGEDIADLQVFDYQAFVKALFAR